MFISKKEKEELYDEIERLSAENECLEARMIELETLFKTLVEINGDEINAKIKEINKTIYTGFRDLFIGEDNGIEKRKAEKNDLGKEPTIKQSKSFSRGSILQQYYDKYHLNLKVRGFGRDSHFTETELATILYLFDQYKYVNEIIKHIALSRNTLMKYAYLCKKLGHLIFKGGMGRVANGCLIYVKEGK